MVKAKSLSEIVPGDSFKNRTPYPGCVIMNDTSKSEIKDSKLVEIISLGENNCILKVPNKMCAQGHALSIYFLEEGAPKAIKRFPTDGEIEHTLRVLSKVVKIEPFNEQEIIIECLFNQYSKPRWQVYLEQFQETQRKIFAEFAKIKGEE